MIRLLLILAFRNIFSHRGGSFLVGSVIFTGTALLAIGSALLGSIDSAMELSITKSLVGHLQVYSGETTEPLQIFKWNKKKIGYLRDYDQVEKVVGAHPNVKAVVPMAFDTSSLTIPHALEAALAGLRANDPAFPPPRVQALIRGLLSRAKTSPFSSADAPELLERALAPDLWAELESSREETLQFLDSKIAPLGGVSRNVTVRYLATDVARYAELFDRFELAEGTLVPPGERGILFNVEFYRAQFESGSAPPIGGWVALRGYSTSGYPTSARVRLYGTFRLKGLGASDYAHAIMDLATHRELRAVATEADALELKAMRASAAIADVSRDAAEEVLFGGAVEETREHDADPEVESGLVPNAAIILRDPSLLAQTRESLRQLTADLRVQLTDWRGAAGIVAGYVTIVRIVFYVGLFIIMLVASIIMTSIMMTLSLDRRTEIGTMRALGARPRLVVALFLVEGALLGLLAGAAGACFSALFLIWLQRTGIPAPNQEFEFLFAGPRLHPTFVAGNLIAGVVLSTAVGLVAIVYPAILAGRITPREAMEQRG